MKKNDSFKRRNHKFHQEKYKKTRCAVSEEKRKCTSFLRRFLRLVPLIEELNIGSNGNLIVRGPTRVFKKVTFMFTSKETTPLINH